MVIKVLGSGCANCKKLLQNVEKAKKDLKRDDIQVEYVTSLEEISKTGLLRTPGLMFDKKIISSGKVPSHKEVKKFIEEYTG